MSLYFVTFLSACSIVPPLIAVMVRLNRMKGKYLPFAILFGVAFLNESFSLITEHFGNSNSINGNIYVLIEFWVIGSIFKRIAETHSNKFLLATLTFGTIIWLTDNFIVNSLTTNNSLFRMVASFLIVYLSVDKINQVIFSGGFVRISNSDLLLSSGFLTYFTYKAFVEAFHLFPAHMDKSFYIILWLVLGIINIIVNLLFTIAILCIRPKNPYSIRLSPA